VVKLSCEIIEFGWTKDRALVDTFIMRLAAYVRERNDYEEEVFPFAFLLTSSWKFCDLGRLEELLEPRIFLVLYIVTIYPQINN